MRKNNENKYEIAKVVPRRIRKTRKSSMTDIRLWFHFRTFDKSCYDASERKEIQTNKINCFTSLFAIFISIFRFILAAYDFLCCLRFWLFIFLPLVAAVYVNLFFFNFCSCFLDIPFIAQIAKYSLWWHAFAFLTRTHTRKHT